MVPSVLFLNIEFEELWHICKQLMTFLDLVVVMQTDFNGLIFDCIFVGGW